MKNQSIQYMLKSAILDRFTVNHCVHGWNGEQHLQKFSKPLYSNKDVCACHQRHSTVLQVDARLMTKSVA